MINIIRLIDVQDFYGNGVIVDMEYEDQDEIKVTDVRCYNIVEGTVGHLVEVEDVIKETFAMYFVNFLKHNK